MTTPFQCDDKETLVAYLYDEIDEARRREVAAHLGSCPSCAREVAGFERVRETLAEWQPPAAELNFALVRQPARVLRSGRWSLGALPAWAQAAAAVLVLAAGAAIANVQVRYGGDGLSVTTGWMVPRAAGAPATAAEDWRPALTAVDTDLRRELQLVRRTQAAPAAPAAASAEIDANALLRRAQALIDQSEQRQRQELALRVTQLNRDFELQRRADLVRMNQTFGGALDQSQREMMNYLRRVSTPVR